MTAKVTTKEDAKVAKSEVVKPSTKEVKPQKEGTTSNKEKPAKKETPPINLDYVEAIRKCLVDHIKEHGKEPKRYYITYEELIKKCNLPYPNINRNPQFRTALGKLLAEVAKQDIEAGKPPITAIVYGKNLYRPRNGFYETLINLKYRGTDGKIAKQLYLDKEWRRELEKEVINYLNESNSA